MSGTTRLYIKGKAIWQRVAEIDGERQTRRHAHHEDKRERERQTHTKNKRKTGTEGR